MDIWQLYESRIRNSGATFREESLRRDQHYLRTKIDQSLSYFQVEIDGQSREVAMINSDNLNEKYMYSMPGEDIRCGSMVYWMDNYWIVTERDANIEVYTKVKLLQCNYLLKWIEVIDDVPKIFEQHCVVEDGTKYMTGEIEDRNFIVTRGDTRIALTIPKTNHTIKFNRQSRFLVDDVDSSTKMSFVITKPLRIGNTYNGDGILKFVLSETNTTDYDNFDLMIPDYYKYFPVEDDTYLPTVGVERRTWI